MMGKIDIKSIVANISNVRSFNSEIGSILAKNKPMIVVLDDDPTGTQTVHNVAVVTNWSQVTIDREFENENTSIFYILTNSRSFRERKAYEVSKTIAERVKISSEKYDRRVIIISRGDSTLRGHYQAETDALEQGLALEGCKQFLIPAFFEGGRYTINDVHYMQNENDFIPVGESAFAKDNTFGYESSNLKEWISEKTDYKISAENVYGFSLEDIRMKGAEYISQTLKENTTIKYYIVNAVCYEDLEAFAFGYLKSGLPAVIRSSASFVNAIANISKSPLLTKQDFENTNSGGLTIVGSYVPKTTLQLKELMKNKQFIFHEINVTQILDSKKQLELIAETSAFVDFYISKNKEVVIYTSRAVAKGENGDASLQIVNEVSNCLIEIVKKIKTTPKYILTKGGITSSDIAVESLGVKKAIVQGQIIPGVPVWKLGKETKFPNVPYIIFPGNVGDSKALTSALTKLT